MMLHKTDAAAASRAEREEMRFKIAVSSQVAQHATPISGLSANMTPRNVATPLPPRNFIHTG